MTIPFAFAALLAPACASGTPAPAPPPRPRLVVMITVDQLLPDDLVRWRGQLTEGLGRLVAEGAVFTETTMIYTHVMRDMSNAPASPLDTLYLGDTK